MNTPVSGPDLQPILAALRSEDDTSVDSGLAYGGNERVRIRVRRRGRRYDISDEGAAVSLAGKPAGWLDVVERLVSVEAFNVNRHGVISVPAVEGRDIASLALRLAETSRQAYLAILELAAT